MKAVAAADPEVRIGPLEERHLTRWIELRNRAFGSRIAAGDVGVRDRFAARLPWTRAAFLADVPVAIGTWFPFRAYLGGVATRTGALGGVVSAPEHRRRGHVRALLLEGLAELREAGVGIAIEYPFDPRFYAALGFASLPAGVRLDAPLDRIAGDAKAVTFEEIGDRADDEMLAVRDAFARTHSFALLRDWRPRGESPARAPQWDGLFDPPSDTASHALGYRTEDGYAVVAVDGVHEGGTLHVVDAAWRTAAGRRRVLDLLGAWRGQLARIRMDLPAGDPLALDEAPRHAAARTAPQARIVDVPAALTPLGGPQEGPRHEAVIEVIDPACAWNARAWRIAVRPGACEVAPAAAASQARVDVRGIPLLLAGVTPTPLMASGLIEGDPAALSGIASLTRNHPPFLGEADHF